MNRCLKLQYELIKVINRQPRDISRDETLEWETVHMASSGRTAWLLSLERGIDPVSYTHLADNCRQKNAAVPCRYSGVLLY